MLTTYFAPAERIAVEDMRRFARLIKGDSSISALLDPHPTPTLLIASTRQIVFANEAFRVLERGLSGDLVGLHLGEALNCDQLAAAPSGCGTGEACRQCGAARVIVESLKYQRLATDECRFSSEQRTLTAEFRLSAYPLSLAGLELTAVAVEDISAEKRRSALERTFFHDVLNTASGLQGLAELIVSGELPHHEGLEFNEQIRDLTESLIEEIQHQRKLLLAERGELEIDRKSVDLRQLLQGLQKSYQSSPAARNRVLQLLHAPEITLTTDPVLLRRVIGNLLKNALEATPQGGGVLFWCESIDSGVRITVHNAGQIPPAIQNQIFHRSFSTKQGTGRGIGTYSVKLFGERYLGGAVEFVTDEMQGTRFMLTLPSA